MLWGSPLFDYSILAQQTELGPRSFPLTGLATLPAATREVVLDILTSATGTRDLGAFRIHADPD